MRKLIKLWGGSNSALTSFGLLLLRLSFGLTMLIGHGIPKLDKLGDSPIQFADPIGVGPSLSLFLALFAEIFCSFLLILGFGTRLALIPLITTMSVALFLVHALDGFNVQEKALLYLIVYLTLFFTGPGRFSIDGLLTRSRPTEPAE